MTPLNIPRPVLAVIAATALSGCDTMAEWIAGGEPEMPVMGAIHRPAVEVIVAIDESKSAIQQQLPQIRTATKDFVAGGEILQEGDSLMLCEVGGKDDGAECTTYEMDGKKSDLLAKIDTVNPRFMDTWLRPALSTIVTKSDEDKPRILALWTDGKEEAETPARVTVPFPVKVMIPSESYAADAKTLCKQIDGDCTVVPAQNGQQFGNALESFAKNLQTEATAAATAKAQEEFAEAQRKYEEEKRGYTAKLKRARNISGGVVGTTIAVILAGIAGLTAYWNRPQLKGVIVDLRNKKQPLFLAGNGSRVKLSELDAMLPKGELKATRAGITVGGRGVLKNGDAISDGVLFFTEENAPNATNLRRMRADYQSSKT